MPKKFVKDWQRDLNISKDNIKKYYQEIKDILKSEGFDDGDIQMGWEIEFNKTTKNRESFEKRAQQVAGDFDRDDKSDSYFPEKGRNDNLSKQFDIRKRDKSGKPLVGKDIVAQIVAEPAARLNINIESTILTGLEPRHENVAYSHSEINSVPLSPLGSAAWISKVPEIIAKKAKDFDIDRIDFSSKLNMNVAESGVHCNTSIWGKNNNGDVVNLLQNSSFDINDKDFKKPSELALSIAKARNEFIKEGLLVFAPAKKSYERYDNTTSGPKYNGFGPRKKRGDMPSAMLRGAGRESFREGADYGKPDEGAFRIEERIISLESLGHPNKSTYPEQTPMAYEVIEAQMYVLKKGVEIWKKRQEEKKAGITVKPLTEESLMYDRSPIMKSKSEARYKILNSDISNVFGQKRLDRMLERHDEYEQLIARDYSPNNIEKGSAINRSNFLKYKDHLTICILTDDHGVRSDQLLEEAVLKAGHKLIVIDQRKNEINVDKENGIIDVDGNVLDINKIDSVIPQLWGYNDSKAFDILDIMKDAGIHSINPVKSIRQAASKIDSQSMFENNGIATPDTYVIKAGQENKLNSNEYSKFLEGLNKPYVIKADLGTQGKQVRFANNYDEAVIHSKEFLDKGIGIVTQQFIKSLDDRAQDIRVMVIGGKIVAAMTRTAKEGVFISNQAQGGIGEFMHPDELSPEQKEISLKAAKASKLGMTGIDIIGSREKPVILEINSGPTLSWFADKCEIPVHEMVVKTLENEIREKAINSQLIR